MKRRTLLAGLALAATPAAADDPLGALAALERRHGGRLGVAVLRDDGHVLLAQRAEERFALCSTFKFLAAAAVLARVDRGEERLDRRIRYARGDLVTYSPATEPHADGDGLTLAEICEAAVTLSDNTAGNLMLDSLGGPEGLTAWLRTIGDDVTRLDRRETALNEATPGDPRDTTTPLAMGGLLHRILQGEVLAPASRVQLVAWLEANRTGGQRLRAGLPAGWRAGDKTGSGNHNATNDVAVLWPPGRPPLLVAAYYAESNGNEAQRNAVLAEVGRIIATAAAGG